ncbi:MAG: hypothetical protein EBZ69_08700 [Alphaproteobacteria bacterium]|nr:hypothetical protein [Alphaproteobacteria bacterium]
MQLFQHVDVAFELYKAAELTDVEASIDAVVIPVVNAAVPALKAVATIFVDVAFVLYRAAELIDVEASIDAVVIPVVNAAVPALKLVATTFVDVAFELYKAAELTDVETNIVPTLIFVSTRFVEVMFTTVKVPPIFKFPERLMLPPVIIEAEISVEATVPIEL